MFVQMLIWVILAVAMQPPGETPACAEFNGDGRCDMRDFAIMQATWPDEIVPDGAPAEVLPGDLHDYHFLYRCMTGPSWDVPMP